jgi:exodeoxyribonuclease X
MKIRAIDFETTGGSPDEICEAGYADLLLPDRTLGKTWSSLVTIAGDVSPSARGVHHISPAEIQSAGISRSSMELYLVDDHPDLVFAAHNAASDAAMWNYRSARWICTYKCAYRAYDMPDYKLQTLRYALDLDRCGDLVPDDATVHRAGPDARLSALLLARIMADRPTATIERMIEISDTPLVLRRCPIGQHRDKLFTEIDDGFLNWIVGKESDMSADLVHTAKVHLDMRRRDRAGAV